VIKSKPLIQINGLNLWNCRPLQIIGVERDLNMLLSIS